MKVKMFWADEPQSLEDKINSWIGQTMAQIERIELQAVQTASEYGRRTTLFALVTYLPVFPIEDG